MQKTIWFMKGYSNLFHAINDIKSADTENNFRVLCSHTNPGFVGFESADFFELEPKAKDAQFLDYCETIIKKYNVDVIFAANRQVALDKNRARLKDLGAEVVTTASYKLIPSINNKAKLYKLLENSPLIKIPAYGVFNNDKDFDIQYKKLKKDHKNLCMKPTHGVYGVGFYILKERSNDLNTFLNQEQKVSVANFKKIITGKKFHQMILMQFLEGAERSVDCLAFHGQLIGGTIRKKNSGGLPQVIEKSDDLMEQVKWIVKTLKLNGMFNVQFKDVQGVPYLLEINPRLSGRSFYSTVAGFNIPFVASQVFSGIKKPDEIQYNVKDNLFISAVNYPVVSTKYSSKIIGCSGHSESL